MNHLAEVAELVAEATEGSDPRLVAAAVLHDTVEDTGLTQAELTAQFGADVAGLGGLELRARFQGGEFGLRLGDEGGEGVLHG